MREPRRCARCGGPIRWGEPVIWADEGLIHYFRVTCEQEKVPATPETEEEVSGC